MVLSVARLPRQIFQIVAFGRLIVTATHGCGLLRRWRGATTLRLLRFLCGRRVRSVSTFFAFFTAGQRFNTLICVHIQTGSSDSCLIRVLARRQSSFYKDLRATRRTRLATFSACWPQTETLNHSVSSCHSLLTW